MERSDEVPDIREGIELVDRFILRNRRAGGFFKVDSCGLLQDVMQHIENLGDLNAQLDMGEALSHDIGNVNQGLEAMCENLGRGYPLSPEDVLSIETSRRILIRWNRTLSDQT